MASPSLFAPDRLFVVPDASSYLPKANKPSAEGAELAGTIAGIDFTSVSAVLTSTVGQEPKKSPLVDAMRAIGAWTWLPCPEPPKPWDQTRVSTGERRVLEGLIRRIAPAVLGHSDAVEALVEAYGFRPRELAQAAARLVISGEITRAAVLAQAGPGESPIKQIEDILIARDGPAAARFFAILAGGGMLVDWHNEPIDAAAWGPLLGGLLGRMLRQSLAVRGHAQRCGLVGELDVRCCAADRWYQKRFKDGILPRLQTDIDASGDSPLGGLSAWQLHRAFRLAAAIKTADAIQALAALDRWGLARLHTRDDAVTTASAIVLKLLSAT